MEFHERLKMLRKENNMTQSALARELTYGSTAISNYESGHNQPSISDLKKIASIFSVSLDYLLCVNDVRHPSKSGDHSQQLSDLEQHFELLTENNREQLFLYMQWLLNLQNTKSDPYAESNTYKNSSLKVAQNTEDYRL